MRSISSSIFTFALLALLFVGCQGNVKLEPAKVIIGTWSVDAEATKSGLGDDAGDLHLEAFEQLKAMEFEFAEDQKFTLKAEGHTVGGTYSIKSETENSFELQITPAEVEEGQKLIVWRVKILDKDRISSFWDEFPVEAVMTRKK